MKYTDEQHIEKITNWNIICDIIFDILPEFNEQLKNL